MYPFSFREGFVEHPQNCRTLLPLEVGLGFFLLFYFFSPQLCILKVLNLQKSCTNTRVSIPRELYVTCVPRLGLWGNTQQKGRCGLTGAPAWFCARLLRVQPPSSPAGLASHLGVSRGLFTPRAWPR